MKKILTITIMALFISFAAKAQLEVKPTIGINLSNVNKEPSGATTSAKLGFQAGGSLMFGKMFYLSPGVYYYQHVTEYVINNPDGSTALSSDEKIAGVKIPVLLGYRFVNPETDPFLNFRVFAGPSLLFNTKSSFSSGIDNDEIDWKETSWGAQLGAGIDISFLFVEAGYEFGLSKTYDGGTAADSFKDVKHNTFIVNAGVRFTL